MENPTRVNGWEGNNLKFAIRLEIVPEIVTTYFNLENPTGFQFLFFLQFFSWLE